MTDTGVIIEEQVEKVSQGFIQIIDLKLNRRLVTQIEVLSPTNKTGDGKKEYQEKQAEVRGSPVHLVELDLLKNGSHTVAIPLVLLRQRFGTYDYLVSINSPPERYRHKVYAFPLDARLPALHIPLAAPDPAVAIELQTVYDRAYDEAGYDDVIDYSRDPLDVRLSQSQLQWLDQLLREKGKR
jgi:hypothetical protein